MASPTWPLGIPTRLRPLEVLADGRGSVVWRARDVELGADVAVKVLSMPPTSTIDPARRVENEARALARLRGVPGILVIHELGRTDAGAAWLACGLVTGGTLEQRAPLGPAEVVEVGACIAGALAGAHDRGVHHGDISPSNIVFTDRAEPLLADFGLADLGSGDGDPGGLTPAFAAPERLAGGPPTAAADVHSLAATLGAVRSGGTVDPVDPVDSALVELLERCRAVVPADRPPAAQVADELASLRSR